ncbi:hypothetical protein Leryth_015234 [Lithospermum erythrorhizon]|nr:hypothetical protein Leryth_015234 [Lithospermum erythrorhizon]
MGPRVELVTETEELSGNRGHHRPLAFGTALGNKLQECCLHSASLLICDHIVPRVLGMHGSKHVTWNWFKK